MESVYSAKVSTIDGVDKDFSEYRGKVLLIVNVASRCGFTPQYKGLQKLYEEYQGKGFEIHHALLTQQGSLTDEKINKIIIDAKLDSEKIRKDLERPEIDEALSITSFIGNGIGARGTPAVFINDKFNPGYVPKTVIEKLLE